jgi:hypothetical protein
MYASKYGRRCLAQVMFSAANGVLDPKIVDKPHKF